jgi:carboxylesterase type B
MVECLQKVDAKIIMNKIKNGCEDLLGWDPDDSALFMGQSVDSSSDENDVFLPKTPKVLMEEGKFSRVPWIIGSNIADGAMFFGSWVINNETNLERFNRQWSKLAPKTFLYNDDVDDVCAVNSAIKNFYFKNVSKIDKNVSSDLANAFTDRVQNYPVKKTAEIHAKGGGQVYLYQFALKGENSIMDFFEPKEGLKDPSYSDDLLYIMETPDFYPNLTRSERFIMYSKNIVKLWTSFATHGKPTELWGNVTNEWPAFDTNSSEPKWMEINEKLEVKSEEQLFKDRINFWEKLNI